MTCARCRRPRTWTPKNIAITLPPSGRSIDTVSMFASAAAIAVARAARGPGRAGREPPAGVEPPLGVGRPLDVDDLALVDALALERRAVAHVHGQALALA